jgi:predicted kinase
MKGTYAVVPKPQRKIMARIHLVVGPVGAGKSTFVFELCKAHEAVRMNLDEWMACLFRPDRPEHDIVAWYTERTARCIEQIWRQTIRTIEVGTDVVLEIGLIRRRDRERIYDRAKGIDLTIYVLDAPRDVRRERVKKRNREKGDTFSMEVPLEFFEMASDLWEPINDDERENRDVRLLPMD